MSTIHCDREIDTAYSFRVDGMWVANQAGVWRAGADTDALPVSSADIEKPAAAERRGSSNTR